MNDPAIIGAWMTRFTKQPDRTAQSLVEEAVVGALAHAGVGFKDIQAIHCGSAYEGMGVAQKTLKGLPFSGVPMINVENACASSSAALREVYAWVKAGLCDVALAIGVDRLSIAQKGPLVLEETWITDTGFTLPMSYAMQANDHMVQFGSKPEDFGRVAVKARAQSARNPYAHFRTATTLDEVMASAMIADPLTLFQCCPKTDGAAAVVVASQNAVRRYGGKPVWIRGSAVRSGYPRFTNRVFEDSAVMVAREALEQAGIGPKDLDACEMHDAFTSAEIHYSQAIGICDNGAEYIRRGLSAPGGGGVAINPSGGLLGRGHPVGATGLAQVTEIVWQLRGEAERRQVEGATWGAAHTRGRTEFELDANMSSMFVFERPSV